MPVLAQRRPISVVLFLAVVLATLVDLLFWGAVDGWLLGGGAVLLLATFGLLRGLWPAWVFLAVVAFGDVVLALTTWPAWGMLLVNLTMAVLLVWPSTLRFVRWPGFLSRG